ncbi:MAG: peptidylprolyl isomerase [Proteobacteria bacterium]|nr:peptidylprolyl isomerase [Pseudomonadota bacterium]
MKNFLCLRSSIWIFSFLFVLNASFSFAEESNKNNMLTIAAIVNDKIITISDLKNRIDLVLIASSIPNTEEAIQHLKKQLIKTLIDEELQIQEADKNGIKISPEDIEQAILDIEQSNNMPKGQLRVLLESNNIPFQTLENQVKANIAWIRFIVEAYGPSVNVSDKEIDDILKTISKSLDKPQRRVSEIFLSIDTPSKEKDVLKTAQDFVKDLRNGANFDMFARQFSEAPSAAQGGDIGWIQQGQLKEDLDQALSNLQKGMISDPVVTKEGIYIFYIQDIEKAGETKQSIIDFKQLAINLFVDKSEEALLKAKEDIDKIKKEKPTCQNLEVLAQSINAQVESINNVPENRLPSSLQNLIKKLPLDQPSEVVPTEQGIGFFMVCKRSEADAQENILPDKEMIQKKIMNQKLELVARRVLKDLRRAAFIETRL